MRRFIALIIMGLATSVFALDKIPVSMLQAHPGAHAGDIVEIDGSGNAFTNKPQGEVVGALVVAPQSTMKILPNMIEAPSAGSSGLNLQVNDLGTEWQVEGDIPADSSGQPLNRIWINMIEVPGGASPGDVLIVQADGSLDSSVSNEAPVVNAGTDVLVTLPATGTPTGHSVTDDGLPVGYLTQDWARVSGPGLVSYAPNSNAFTPVITFDTAGSHVFQLRGRDSALTNMDTMTFTVAAGGAAATGTHIGVYLYLPFDEGNQLWADHSTNAFAIVTNNGSLMNTFAGKVGQGVTSSATTAYFTAPIGAHLNAASAFSISLWTFQSVGGPQSPIADDGAGLFNGILCQSGADNIVLFVGGSVLSAGNNYWTAGSWRHIVCIWRNGGGAEEYYVDGVQIVLPSETGSSTWPASMRIGQFVGTIDEVIVWDRVITPGEISSLWNGGAGVGLGL